MKIGILNGPNLNLLGIREQSIYGKSDFESYFEKLKSKFPEIELSYYQSNVEGELIDQLHNWRKNLDGILFNAGGYTHTSVALHDAIKAIDLPVIEIHISNPVAREDFRKHSLIAAACAGSISGFGLNSYLLGLKAFQEDWF